MAAAVSFASCVKQNPDNNGNGDKPETELADVFFSSQNGDYCYYVGSGEDATAELIVVRENATKADEYAIKVISADEGVTIPQSASFAEGETRTSISVTGPTDAQSGTIYSFEIMFTGDNVNPSANSTAGTTRCEGSFYFYQEMTAAACFLPWSGTGDVYNYMGDIKQTIWKLDEYNYIFKNFLGSKYDMKVILNSANNYIQTISYGYDFYTASDEEGGVEYYFYNESVEDFADNDYWEEFAPKGDSRVISGITLFLSSAGAYSAFNPSVPYFYFACPQVYFYVSESDTDYSFTNWQYLCFFLYSDEELAKCNFEGFPELAESPYPEPVYSEEEKDGKVPVQFYLDNEGIYLDTQYASVTDKGYLIEDFMMSDMNLCIIPNGSSFSFEVTDAEGNVVSNTVNGGYRYLGMDYIYPWSVNDYWCIYQLSVYDDSEYCVWDEANREAYFYASYNIYDGDQASWLGDEDGYIYIYW